MSMGRLRCVSAALAGTAAFLSLVAFAPQAIASHVQCGEAITQDTRLDSDLVACPSDGIVISADDITLDLNGHTIDGVGATSSAGVRETNQNGVTIENGTIRDFASAVAIAGDSEHGAGHVIRRLTISGGAIFMFGFPARNLIERNTVFGSRYGILVSDGTGNLIRRNSLVGNLVAGIFLGGGSGNEITRNTGVQNGVGIALGDTGFNSVHRNVVTENSIGIQLRDSVGNSRIERNVALRNSVDGIQTNDNGFGPGEDLIAQNVASENGDDGIEADSGWVLSANIASRNGDLGIEADDAAPDGGGNTASQNGNAVQCVTVVCLPTKRR